MLKANLKAILIRIILFHYITAYLVTVILYAVPYRIHTI